MAEKKATLMVIKVDLDCEKCHKKIKKILGKIPEIQKQIYDEKANTVTVTVFSCSPEKIKKKICCKGGKTIKGIEIKAPPEPKPEPKPESKPELKPEPDSKPPCKTPSEPVLALPLPIWPCCRECYGGYGRGPCYHGFPVYGTPVPWYEPYGRPVYDSWGGGYGYGYAGCRGVYYVVSDDSSPSCSVM